MNNSFLVYLPLLPSVFGPGPNSTSVIASNNFSNEDDTYLGLDPDDKIYKRLGPETK